MVTPEIILRINASINCWRFCDRIKVPLTDEAKRIYNKYKVEGAHPLSTVFDTPSSQKINDYLKEAAKLAGLNREENFVYYIGSVRHEEVKKIHEFISNHMARRTFVVTSLSLGIPAEIVMKATDHSDYESMKPILQFVMKRRSQRWKSGTDNRTRAKYSQCWII